MKSLRYKAFMSYCHTDEAWARWLHKSLESYRVPRRLIGAKGSHGEVPARLTPIFRDRDELSSATDLSAKIRDALADSESLLVICSPAAARSKWVNEEIRLFRAMGRGSRIYCVIVDGDPQAVDSEQGCFPPALLEREDHHLVEPLAADVRKSADGKSLAKLKLAASILGIRLDELRQREQQRKWKLQAVSGIAVLLVAVLIFFSIQSRLAEQGARLAQEAQQVAAESMLAQFLEQTEKLVDVADLETRKAFGEVMTSYLANLDPADLTPESRRQLGVALSHRALILRAEGHMDQAMEVFRRAQQTLQALVDDSEGDQDSLFELSQVEYWIGQVHLDLGQLEQAGTWFSAYADASDALHRLQPDNADWTMEAAYALSNLGNLESRRTASDPALVLKYYQSALEFNELAARQDPAYVLELTDSHADLADAWLGVCNLEQAMAQRIKAAELAAEHYNLNPASNRLKGDYAHALSGLSRVQQKAGLLERAMENLGKSLDIQQELVEEDPSNLGKRWNLLIKAAFQAQLLQLSGDETAGWEMSLALEKDIRELMRQDQDYQIEHSIGFGMFLRDFAYRAYRKGELDRAEQLLAESIRQLAGIAGEHPDNKKVLRELAMSYFYYWDQHHATLPDDNAAGWIESARKALNLQGCADLDGASRQAVMVKNLDQARTYVTRLIERGYHEPEFKRFCAMHGLCTE